MKNSSKLRILAALAPLAFCSGEVFAGATITGATCYTPGSANNDSTLQRGINGNLNQGASAINVICPIAVDHQLPNTVTFRIQMYDRNPAQNITCNGFAYDQNGIAVGVATPDIVSNGIGVRTGTVTLPTQAASYTYALSCAIPPSSGGLPSGLGGIRVF